MMQWTCCLYMWQQTMRLPLTAKMGLTCNL
jgi:hypothetical protein